MDKYSLSRDMDAIAKFLGKVASWNHKYELYKIGIGEIPRSPSRDAKWPAYEAASRIESALGMPFHAYEVSGLAQVLATAITEYNRI